MKVLIISNKPPFPSKDGGAIAIFNLARGLAQNQIDVTILAMNTTRHYVDKTKMNNPYPIQLIYVDVDTRINFVDGLINFLFSKTPYTASRFNSKNFEKTLEQHLSRETYDIIQIEGPYLGFYIGIIRKLSKARIVLRAHNLEHEIWMRIAANERNILKKYYYKNLSKRIVKFEKRIFQQVDAILPITDRDKQHMEKWGINKPMLVTPVGIDLIKTHATITHQRSVMYLGALDWAPNQEGLIWFVEKVWPQVIKANPYMIFHVAGRNCPDWLHKHLITVRNLLFHGEIEKSSDFYEIGDVMVVPILSGSGMRVKIIEAMAYGKVVVTTTLGAEGIAIEQGKHVLVEDEPTKFAQKIIQLMSDDVLKRNIANEAIKFIEANYNNQIIAANVVQFYNNLITNR